MLCMVAVGANETVTSRVMFKMLIINEQKVVNKF